MALQFGVGSQSTWTRPLPGQMVDDLAGHRLQSDAVAAAEPLPRLEEAVDAMGFSIHPVQATHGHRTRSLAVLRRSGSSTTSQSWAGRSTSG